MSAPTDAPLRAAGNKVRRELLRRMRAATLDLSKRHPTERVNVACANGTWGAWVGDREVSLPLFRSFAAIQARWGWWPIPAPERFAAEGGRIVERGWPRAGFP